MGSSRTCSLINLVYITQGIGVTVPVSLQLMHYVCYTLVVALPLWSYRISSLNHLWLMMLKYRHKNSVDWTASIGWLTLACQIIGSKINRYTMGNCVYIGTGWPRETTSRFVIIHDRPHYKDTQTVHIEKQYIYPPLSAVSVVCGRTVEYCVGSSRIILFVINLCSGGGAPNSA